MNPFVNHGQLRDTLLTLYYRNGWRGFLTLLRLLKGSANRALIETRNQFGAKLLLSPTEYIDSFVLRSGYYESEVLEAILPFLENDSVLWDIGANLGLHAVTAKYLRPQARVVCIEPSPVMAARIFTNAQLNNLDIEIVTAALSISQGFQKLHLVEGNAGMTTLVPWEKAHYGGYVMCWCDTGDNLVASHTLPSPTVIKLDVEGSELAVLRGLTTVLNDKSLKAIVFEAEADLLKHGDSELYNLLTSIGFKITELVRQENTQHNLENFLAVRN